MPITEVRKLPEYKKRPPPPMNQRPSGARVQVKKLRSRTSRSLADVLGEIDEKHTNAAVDFMSSLPEGKESTRRKVRLLNQIRKQKVYHRSSHISLRRVMAQRGRTVEKLLPTFTCSGRGLGSAKMICGQIFRPGTFLTISSMVVDGVGSRAEARSVLLNAIGENENPPAIELQRWTKDDARTKSGKPTEKVRNMQTSYSFTAAIGCASEDSKRSMVLKLQEWFRSSPSAHATVSSCEPSKDPLEIYPRTVNQAVQELLNEASLTPAPQSGPCPDPTSVGAVYWADGAGESLPCLQCASQTARAPNFRFSRV